MIQRAMRPCTECGKIFLPATEHLYKVPKIGKQCSYTCWNVALERSGATKNSNRASIRRMKG